MLHAYVYLLSTSLKHSPDNNLRCGGPDILAGGALRLNAVVELHVAK